MLKLKLSALALLALVACKSKEEPAAPAKTKAEASALKRLDVPRDILFAGSAHLRVVDVALGQVVSGIDLSRALTDIAFSPDGKTAYLAASDGVRVVDVETAKVTAKLSSSPARQLVLLAGGDRLGVLAHDVAMVQGHATPSAFRFDVLDPATGKVEKTELVGERVLGLVPSADPARNSMILFESGEVRLVRGGAPLSSEGKAVDLEGGLEPEKGRLVMRPYFAVSSDGATAYVPVEAKPARIVAIDLISGGSRVMSLGEASYLRGLAVAPDGKTLVVNAMKKLVTMDLASGKILGSIELDGAHLGVVLSADGRRAYLAQTVHENGGAITAVGLDPLRVQGKIHLADISPWVLAIKPNAAVALR